jgi:hypothetical protein
MCGIFPHLLGSTFSQILELSWHSRMLYCIGVVRVFLTFCTWRWSPCWPLHARKWASHDPYQHTHFDGTGTCQRCPRSQAPPKLLGPKTRLIGKFFVWFFHSSIQITPAIISGDPTIPPPEPVSLYRGYLPRCRHLFCHYSRTICSTIAGLPPT